MKKSLFRIVISVTLAVVLTASVCVSGFSAYAQDVGDSEGLVSIGDSEYNPHSDDVEQDIIDNAENLPDSIDLRNFNGQNYVTPVKFQNPFGSCWAFGISAAAETSFLYENDLGVPAGEVNDYVNFSEKYTNWYLFHAITDDEVSVGTVRASQVGEGFDVSQLEAGNINAVYDLGGSAGYGPNFFASGFGPIDESETVNGEDCYAYHGKNGWRVNDRNETDEMKALRKEFYRKQLRSFIPTLISMGVIESADRYDEWFDNYWHEGSPAYENSYTGSEYAGWDDWSLPLTEEYINPGLVSYFKDSYTLTAPAQKDAQGNYVFSEAGVASIKSELANGHAVAIGYKADQSRPNQPAGDSGYMNTVNWAQYYNGPVTMDHEVAIVGYDNNYPKENFTRTANGETVEGSTPPADGAFIVKNSWGALTEEDKATVTYDQSGTPIYQNPNASAWGYEDTGYFYLSYYDHSISRAYCFDFYSYDETKYLAYNYDQYDLLQGSNYKPTVKDEEEKMANVFDAEEDEYLCQISTMTSMPGTNVHYEIYKDVGDNDPCSGTLLEQGDDYKEISGYQRIDLKGEYFLKKGEKYSVVITQTAKGDDGEDDYVVLFAAGINTYGGVKINTKINAGESYVYEDGGWTDMSEIKDDLIDTMYQDLIVSRGSEEEVKKILKNGKDDLAVDNYPVKAFLVSAGDHDSGQLIGDVNQDGAVTVSDATAIQRFSIELPVEGIFNNRLADVNNDGVITVTDATCVQRYAAQFTKKTGNAGKYYKDITPTSDYPQII